MYYMRIDMSCSITLAVISEASRELIFESTVDKMDRCLGVDISEFKLTPQCAQSLPPLISSPTHHVLFKVGGSFDEPPKPLSDIYNDKWDANFVRLPCSPNNMYRIVKNDGIRTLTSQWELIKKSLSKKITSSHELANAILSYNDEYKQRCDFTVLHHLFNVILKPEETEEFFQKTLPQIIRLALQLPFLCTEPIPLLKRNSNHTISLSQLQISSLLANAFLCTFPGRSSYNTPEYSEYRTYSKINFNGLYTEMKGKHSNRKLEKLKCLLHYFGKVTNKEPCGVVSFERKFVDTSAAPDWISSKRQLCKLIVSPNGTIEIDGRGMLQMIFADKSVGGLVLQGGCVQEEIRLIQCPELITSMLFAEQLDDKDALVITGCETYCRSIGYANTFKFAGDFQDKTPFDSWGRRYTEVVVIDAKRFSRNVKMQYEPHCIEREVVKAFCGFSAPGIPTESRSAVATGNWGCGVFRGDPQLKLLIQLIAATEAGRDVMYFTFHDNDLSHVIYNMYSILTSKHVTVGNLWALLLRYNCTFKNSKPEQKKLYEYIMNTYSESGQSADLQSETLNSSKKGD